MIDTQKIFWRPKKLVNSMSKIKNGYKYLHLLKSGKKQDWISEGTTGHGG